MIVRQMQLADIEAAVALQRDCFPPPFPEELLWKHEHLEQHIATFSPGQMVVEDQGSIIGSASSLRISEENWHSHRSWEDTVGGAFLRNHDPEGSTLYGVDISIHPDHRGRGLGRTLYEARFRLVTETQLTRYGTACRLPGYANWTKSTATREAHNTSLSSEQDPVWCYAKAVESGAATDRTLTPLLRYGLSLIGVIHEYMEDEESGNAAALLEWKP